MKSLFQVVQDYFIAKEWPVQQHEEMPILRFKYEGDHGKWFCFARVREETKQFIFLSVLEDKVPEDERLAMAEFITRANFGLNIGNFEMDFEDGEIRYKTSVDVSKDRLTYGLIDPLIQASFVTMDDYLPGIRAVLAGEQIPQEAVDAIIAKLDKEDEEYDFIFEK